MQREDYAETLVIDGRLVPVGLDDYGQCYYFEYVDENGQLQEMSCGSYNFNYKQEIKDFLSLLS